MKLIIISHKEKTLCSIQILGLPIPSNFSMRGTWYFLFFTFFVCGLIYKSSMDI